MAKIHTQPFEYAIGIGAQKCASSWLHAVLSAHPHVAGSDPKEVDFFSYHFDHGYRWYEGHFGKGKVRFDNSPSYFHDPRAPRRVADFAPDAKIVLLLRDPVERAYSNHLHEVAKGHIPAIGFAEGMKNNPAYLEQSLYTKHVRQWQGVFGDQILCLLTEEIAKDPQGAADQVIAHLGLPHGQPTAILHEGRNVSDTARSPTLRKVLRRGGDSLRKMGLEEQLSHLKSWPLVRRILDRNAIPLRSIVPAMTAEERRFLIAQLSDDLRQLAPALGRETLPWASWVEMQASDNAKAGHRYPSAINR